MGDAKRTQELGQSKVSLPISKPIVLCLSLVLCALFFYGGVLHADSPATPHKAGDLAFWEEIAFWETIKNSKDPSEFQAYLDAYPNGRFARLAELRIKTLKGEADPEPAGETAPVPKDLGEVPKAAGNNR